jgi:lysozyme
VSPAAPRAGRAARPAAPVSSPQPFGHTRAVLLAPRMDAAARRHDIDPLLLHAIAHVESRHDPASVSPAGARGLMQVMPATGARFGAATPGSLHHVDTNLEVSAAYLKTLQQRFGGDLALVLAAYNAGEGAVERHGRRVPPYAETRRYVERVLHWYAHLRRVARAQTPLS